MKKEIEAAVEWWKHKLSSFVFQNNGDPLQTALATWVRERQPKPTPQQIEEFGSALTAILTAILSDRDHWETAKANPGWGSAVEGRCLDVDYGPDRVLSAAAQAAGIHHGATLFPIKTVMHINPDRVTVRQGYGAKEEVIYPPSQTRD